MAFNVHWKIFFKSLRAGSDYCVNIYKDGSLPSGYPLTLKGGAQPFTTEEDSDDDMFTPIRTQSGYIRIVDDGLAETSGGVSTSWNWKDLLPATDTDRPVVLQKKVSGVWTTVWLGFMQAQNFGGTLYGNPQEREFPVQCPLTVTQGTDINYQQTAIQNFAYLLKQIVDSIPSTARPQNFMIQGGADAQAWLLNRIDWQNFVSEDGDGNLVARFSMYQCLEDMCRFWGWTARTCGTTMYLTCADDAAETTFLSLTTTQLATLAAGTTAGSTSATFTHATLSGDIFANTNQDDYLQRGYNKAVVNADTNRGNEDVLNIFDDGVIKAMKDLGRQSSMIHNVIYTNDLLNVNQNYMKITCREGYASLNTGYFGQAYNAPYVNVVRIKKSGANNVTPYVSIETKFEHDFNDGFLMMYGQTYRFTEEFLDPYRGFFIGRSYMYAKIAIGPDKQHAMWWNGQSWQATETYCRISIGNKPNNIDQNKNEFVFLYLQEFQPSVDDWGTNILPVSGLQGKLFIDLLGTNNDRVEEIDGERSFELKDLNITFTRNPGVVKHGSASDFYYIEDIQRPTNFEYKASNNNSVRNEWNADCVYATENNCKFSYGELINPKGTFVTTVPYGGNSERPEQHAVNRVVNFWASSKRRLQTELKANAIPDITPQYKVTLDGTTGHPIGISHDYWNDVTTLTILEL